MTRSSTENLSKLTIEELPDEVLEFILSLIPPYKDLHDCMAVSKRWRRCVLNVTKTKLRNLHRAIVEFDIAWNSMTPVAMAPTISKRYSHSAAVHDNSMYIYGGCTCSMTTFNDLWRLDLSKRQWVRPLTMGTYPAPKACSTMVAYKDNLVLFGGCTYPPSYPLHQTWFLFDELHTYNIKANTWRYVSTLITPPPTAGHSVSVHKNYMVVFGGLQKPSHVVHSTKTNEVWKLDLDNWTWTKQETLGKKPSERYGQSQTMLDDENLLVIGGSGGQSFYYSDAWVLNMSGNVWKWREVEVRNSGDAPMNLWCNPVCKVGDKIIVLNRSRHSTTPPFVYYSKGVWLNREAVGPNLNRCLPNNGNVLRQVDRDENVNGRRGTLRCQKRANPDSRDPNEPGPAIPEENSIRDNDIPSTSGLSLAAFNDSPNNSPRKATTQSARARQLKKAEEKWKKTRKEKENQCSPIVTKPKSKKSVLSMYVLDISHALDENPHITWLPLKNDGVLSHGPEETVLYTLVEGKSELIMFGGIQKDANQLSCTNNLSNQVTNSLHFITAPKYVI